ncbi:uroporphyrinogen-III C-methyltransferase [Pseudaquabacterium rugosum]|uniref:Uroporphyrinogen-III C-methyltransferase n=1 Tax=Pseudaquabacterium rugosum TaxID=2984194 RepID=A0ABU9BFA9_9BURK
MAGGGATASTLGAQVARTSLSGPVWLVGAALAGALSVAAITLAVYGQQRVKALEQELVRRQQDSQGQAVEARTLAQQAQDTARALDSRLGLLEARLAESALQRSQLEELILQLSRSRDENVLADVDAALRVAQQQSALTGSLEPLAAALRQADDRLARLNQPRLERVRRALARDIDRVRAVSVSDLSALVIRLDEAVRSVDELPLLAQPLPRGTAMAAAAASAQAPAAVASRGRAASATAAGQAASDGIGDWLVRGWRWTSAQGDQLLTQVGDELRGLLRVTRIANPEAALVAPEQGWFLRENLKLRLLNARLALLARQFDTVQSDMREALTTLDRYFDGRTRRVAVSRELLQQVAQQARQISLPRPDETLAAIAAVQAGR